MDFTDQGCSNDIIMPVGEVDVFSVACSHSLDRIPRPSVDDDDVYNGFLLLGGGEGRFTIRTAKDLEICFATTRENYCLSDRMNPTSGEEGLTGDWTPTIARCILS